MVVPSAMTAAAVSSHDVSMARIACRMIGRFHQWVASVLYLLIAQTTHSTE
jgi:hypothetical protein